MNGTQQPAGERIKISAAEIQELQALIRDACGITHGIDSPVMLERRLGPRLAALGLSSFRAYCELLRGGADRVCELAEAIELLTTHETYFFRESLQLASFRDHVVPALAELRRGAGRLSVLSAGCSTGEEAYTLAMILSGSPHLRGWTIKVTGVDISRKVLSVARHAVYGPSSFRGEEGEAHARCFEATAEGRRVRPELRALCHFRQANLLDEAAVVELGPFDAIFCRNVLMYMATDGRRRVVDAFHRALCPGGFLLLGHSESLINLATPFELVQIHQDLVYRRSP